MFPDALHQLFSELASRHEGCTITVTRTAGADSEGGLASADSKSPMLLLQLVLACGAEIEISAEGDGAQEAVKALVELVEARFGVDLNNSIVITRSA